jgi:cardiolipin synthase
MVEYHRVLAFFVALDFFFFISFFIKLLIFLGWIMRKVLRFVFSRYFVSAVVILAELSLIFYLMTFAYMYSKYALAVMIVVEILSVVSLVNRDCNPEFKVSWLAIILVLPIFGATLYAIFYSHKMPKRTEILMNEISENLDKSCHKECAECNKCGGKHSTLSDEDSLAAIKAQAILNDDTFSAVYGETSSSYFGMGEEMFAAMLKDIAKAEKFIFLEYFIIEGGKMWDSLHRLLLEKADTGVEVRLIYDDVGCMKTLPSHYDRRLAAEGISALRYSPITPRVTSAHNNRDHRKILIIDGRIAYTGGINIADEYINEKERFGIWKDGGIRVEGCAAHGFLKLFLSAWDLTAGECSECEKYLSAATPSANSDGGYYLPFGSGPSPIYRRPVGKNALLNIINQAQRYVYITTPYLIIDYDLTQALRNAAIRGVNVTLITPGIPDKKLVNLMTRSAYPYLMEAGVKIAEYKQGFIHEKCVISDDEYALIGTINLDYRSLVHHFEDAVWIYKSPTVISARDEFLKTLSDSEIKNQDGARLTFVQRCVRNLIRVFAPLL